MLYILEYAGDVIGVYSTPDKLYEARELYKKLPHYSGGIVWYSATLDEIPWCKNEAVDSRSPTK